MFTLFFILFGTTASAVPTQFTHQGRLLDPDGAPLTGETNITFRVTSAATEGTVLWEEPIVVGLTNGFYAAVLGANEDENPLDTSVFSQSPLWLEIQLEGEDPMNPRSPIRAVPYASMSEVTKHLAGGSVNASAIYVMDSLVINESGEWVGPPPAGIGVPSGGIIMWSGDTIPEGWKLCDGTEGTPDLRDRFVLGAGGSYATGEVGGGGSDTIDVSKVHVSSSSPDVGWAVPVVKEVNSVSSPKPPYYALAFIQKD